MYRQNGILHTSKAKINIQNNNHIFFSKQYGAQLTLRIGILTVNPECGGKKGVGVTSLIKVLYWL